MARGLRLVDAPLAGLPDLWQTLAMLNILSIIIGIIALLLAIPTTIPLLGWVNWFILPIAAFGLLLGLLSAKNTGRNVCLVVMGLCALRLFVGGGLI